MHKTYVVVLIRSTSVLGEVLLMSTHNISFYGEIRKNMAESSPNTPSPLTSNLAFFVLGTKILEYTISDSLITLTI